MFRFILIVFLMGAAVAPTPAQTTTRQLAEAHPGAQVVLRYLRLSLNHEFEKAAALMEPDSLKEFQRQYVERMKQPIGLDEVMAMCRAVGKEDEKDVEKMEPAAFYAAYNQGLQKRYNVSAEAQQKIADTLDLIVLAAADERPDLVHMLVRTKHETMRNRIQNLELITLVKKDDQWLVSLGEQLTKVQPLTPKPAADAPPPPPPAAEPKPEAKAVPNPEPKPKAKPTSKSGRQ